MNTPWKNKKPTSEDLDAFLICLGTLMIFSVLYTLRFIDNNSLVSWGLVFRDDGFTKIFILSALGCALAFFLSRRALPGTGLIFVLAFAMSAVFWREPELVIDSSRYFTQAKHLGQYGVLHFLKGWGGDIVPWTDLPMVPFLYGLVFRLFGESRIYIQILNSMMFASTVALTAMIGNDLFSEDESGPLGAMAAIALLAFPYLFTQVPLMLVDVPGMFFLTLSIYLFQRTMRSGGFGLTVLSSLAIFSAFLSKYSIWMMLSVLCVIFLLNARGGTRKAFLRGGAVFLFAGVMVAAFLFSYMDVLREQIELLVTYQMPGLKRWSESFVSTFMFQVHPYVTIGALYSVFVAIKRRDPKYLVISWVWIIMLFLMVQRARYLVPAYPMLALMASYGLCEIKSPRVKKAIVYNAAIVSFVLATFAYLPALGQNNYVNLKDAARFLDSMPMGEARVLTLPQRSAINPAVSVPLLDIYTRKKITYCYDMKPAMSRREIDNSSFRFTWGFRNPDYYANGFGAEGQDCSLRNREGDIIVIIHSRTDNVIENRMPEYRLLRRFNEHVDGYNFKTFVDIYELKIDRDNI